MQREGYRVTAEFEANHWWFRSRRDLFMLQVARAAREQDFPRRDLRILDYGCGTGHNLDVLSKFGEVRGADVPNVHATDFRIETRQPILDLSADTKPFWGSFEIVTALDVLEHIEDDVDGLAGIGRFLAPGGQIVLTVPAFQWLWSGEDVISDHKRRYTRNSLSRVCEEAGFEIRYLSYFNLSVLPAMALAIWVRRLFAGEGSPESNLHTAPTIVNELLYRITALEASWVGAERWHPPAGASLICRCAPRNH